MAISTGHRLHYLSVALFLGVALGAGVTAADSGPLRWAPEDTDWPTFRGALDGSGVAPLNSMITTPQVRTSIRMCGAVYAGTVTADLTGDGVVEAVTSDTCGYLRAFAAGSRPLWSVYVGGATSTAAIGDVDNDGRPEVVVNSGYGRLYAFDGENGRLLWPPVSTGFDHRTAPLLADIDEDGRLEIVVGGNVFNGEDGSRLWARGSTLSSPYGSSVVGDVTQDGHLDVVDFGYGCRVRAADGRSGAILWTSGALQCPRYHYTRPSPALTDVNGDGHPDVLVVTGHAVYAIDGATGGTLWGRGLPSFSDASPVIADLEGDGTLDLVVLTNAYGSVGSKVNVLDAATGEEQWTYTVTHDGRFYDLLSTPVIADVDNDGVREIVFGAGDSRVYAVSNPDDKTVGTVRWTYQHARNIRTPIASADLDGDGGAEIIFGSDYGYWVVLASAAVTEPVPPGGPDADQPDEDAPRDDVDAAPPEDDVEIAPPREDDVNATPPSEDDVDVTPPSEEDVEEDSRFVSLTVPTDVALGDDADGDGVPATVTVLTTTTTIPRDDAAAWTQAPGEPIVLAADPDDADASNPGAPETVSASAPRGVKLEDTTGDGVPDAVVVRTLTANATHGDGEPATELGTGEDVVLVLPVLPQTARAEVPRGVELADLDGDGVPDAIVVHTTRVRADRSDARNPEIANGSGFRVILPDVEAPAPDVPEETSVDVPAGVAFEDRTGDEVPDEVVVDTTRVTVPTDDPADAGTGPGDAIVIPIPPSVPVPDVPEA